MTAHQGYRVATEADGPALSPFEHLSGGYRWNKTPGWTGGNIPEVRENIPPSSANKSRNKSAEAKAERFREFTRLREEENLSVTAAARALGIGSTSARMYEAERKSAIAAQSPEHAALAADFEAAQEGGTP